MDEEQVQGQDSGSEPADLYALVDVTSEEEGFAFIKRAPLTEIILWGKIFGMDGRVTKRLDLLTLEQLQYLYWNVGLNSNPSAAPGDDLEILQQQCEELSTKVPVDETSEEELRSRIPDDVLKSVPQRQEASNMGQGSKAEGSLEKGGKKKAAAAAEGGKKEKAVKEVKEKKEKAPKDPTGRPSAGTATGKVWEICDSLIGKGDVTPTRKAVIEACEACEAQDINPATAGVQYGKWIIGMKRQPAPKVEKPPAEKKSKKKAAEAETEAETTEDESEDEDSEDEDEDGGDE
jgi:hypothetical protein